MDKRKKILLNGVEVDSDFTGIIEERNGKIVRRNSKGDVTFDESSGPGKTAQQNHKEEIGKVTTAILIAVLILKALLAIFD